MRVVCYKLLPSPFNLLLICEEVKMGIRCDLQTHRFRGYAATGLALSQGRFQVSGLARSTYVVRVSTRHEHRYRGGHPVRHRPWLGNCKSVAETKKKNADLLGQWLLRFRRSYLCNLAIAAGSAEEIHAEPGGAWPRYVHWGRAGSRCHRIYRL